LHKCIKKNEIKTIFFGVILCKPGPTRADQVRVRSCDPAKKRPLAAFILFYIFVQGACGLAALRPVYIYTYILAAWVRQAYSRRWPEMPGVLPWAKRSVALADTWAKKWGAIAPRVD